MYTLVQCALSKYLSGLFGEVKLESFVILSKIPTHVLQLSKKRPITFLKKREKKREKENAALICSKCSCEFI